MRPGTGPILRSLSHRNFRLFFGGQTLSMVGTWAQSTAMPLLLYRLTQSSYLMGVFQFVAQMPSLLLTPLAGVFVERADRRKLLIATQALAMIQALGLALLVWFGYERIWQIVLFNVSLNAINAFDMTARQAFLGEMLDDRADLANAIALNSSLVQLARLFGPFIAVLLLDWTGEAGCFLVNGLSFLAVIAALMAMRLPSATRSVRRGPVFSELADGARYALASAPIRSLLAVVAMVSIVGMPYTVLLPEFNDRILGADRAHFGRLLLASGVGALAASVMLAWRGVRGALERVACAPIGVGLCVATLAVVQRPAGALVLMALTGFCVLTLINSANTLIQSIVRDDARARVMSFYTWAFLGTSPLGALVAGGASWWFGVRGGLAVCGLACATLGAVSAVLMETWKADVKATLRAKLHPPVAPRAGAVVARLTEPSALFRRERAPHPRTNAPNRRHSLIAFVPRPCVCVETRNH
ncbi:MAG: MFS transporter [Gemmataceae bacterium]